jgi:iron complex transport system permease protein
VTGSLAVLALLLVAVLWMGIVAGPSPITVGQVSAALFGEAESGAAADIVLRVRLPRILLAALVGASLAVAGVLFQALLRNPLADPFVLGVSGGAAVGGIAALSLGATLGWGYAAVPPAAFAGALLTTVVLYAVAGRGGSVSGTNLLLTGVVFNAFASAAIVFLASLAGLTEGASIFLWLIGSLSAIRVDVAGWVALFLFAGLATALPLARNLNLLALGEESARQLGVDVGRQQRLLLLATSLMVGAAVAVAPATPLRVPCSGDGSFRWGRSPPWPVGPSSSTCCAAISTGPSRRERPDASSGLRRRGCCAGGDAGPARRQLRRGAG